MRVRFDRPSKVGALYTGSFFYEVELRESYSSSKCPRTFPEILVVIIPDHYSIPVLISSVIIRIGITVYKLLSVLSITLRTAGKTSVRSQGACVSAHAIVQIFTVCGRKIATASIVSVSGKITIVSGGGGRSYGKAVPILFVIDIPPGLYQVNKFFRGAIDFRIEIESA